MTTATSLTLRRGSNSGAAACDDELHAVDRSVPVATTRSMTIRPTLMLSCSINSINTGRNLSTLPETTPVWHRFLTTHDTIAFAALGDSVARRKSLRISAGFFNVIIYLPIKYMCACPRFVHKTTTINVDGTHYPYFKTFSEDLWKSHRSLTSVTSGKAICKLL